MFVNKELEKLLVEETKEGLTQMKKGHDEDKTFKQKEVAHVETSLMRKEDDEGKILMKKDYDQGKTTFMGKNSGGGKTTMQKEVDYGKISFERKGNQQGKHIQQFSYEESPNFEENPQSQQKYPIKKKIGLLDLQKAGRSFTGPLLQTNFQDVEMLHLQKEFDFEENAQFQTQPLLPKKVQLEKSLDQKTNTQLKQKTLVQKKVLEEKVKWIKCCTLNLLLWVLIGLILYLDKGYVKFCNPSTSICKEPFYYLEEGFDLIRDSFLFLYQLSIPYFIKVNYIDEFQNYPIQSVFIRRCKFISNVLLRIVQIISQVYLTFTQGTNTQATFYVSVLLIIWPVQYIIVYSYAFKNYNYAKELVKDYFTGGYSWKSYNEDLSYFRITHYRFLFYLVQDIGFSLVIYFQIGIYTFSPSINQDLMWYSSIIINIILSIRDQIRFANFQWQIKKQQEELYEQYQSKVGWLILSCLPIILFYCLLNLINYYYFSEDLFQFYSSNNIYSSNNFDYYLGYMFGFFFVLVCCFRKKLNPVYITPLDLSECPQRHKMKFFKGLGICSLCQKKSLIFRFCDNCKFNRYICIRCTVDICRKYQKKLKKKRNNAVQKLFSFTNYSVYRHQCKSGHKLKYMNELKYKVAKCNRVQCSYYKYKFLVKKGTWHCTKCEVEKGLKIDFCKNCINACKAQYIYQEYQTIQLKCIRGHSIEEEEIEETIKCFKCFRVLDQDQQTAWYCHTCTDYVLCNRCREDNHFEEFENRELFYFILKNPKKSLFQALKDIFKKKKT